MSTAQEPQPEDKPSEARERLRQHFLDSSLEQHPSKWHDLYVQEWLPWDRSAPNPALVDTITQRGELLGPAASFDSSGNVVRKKALVPGCGKGYDVLLLASFGYDAVGLDVSKLAVKLCEEFRQQNEGKGEYQTKNAAVGIGAVHFVVGDFFENTWAEAFGGKFDLIYDYTFLSALPPPIRPSWARRLSELLSPEGRLICVEFPNYKPPSTGGPPWAVRTELYVELFKRPGEDLSYDEEGFVIIDKDAKENEYTLERMAHWKAERTHPVGEGHDCVSVWRHKQQ